ncbi:xylan 1,4-beta-xylosidase, partial [Streptomyces nigra]
AEFPPGTRYRKVSVDEPGVRVLATDEVILAVNTLDRRTTVKIDGRKTELQAYEVRWLGR